MVYRQSGQKKTSHNKNNKKHFVEFIHPAEIEINAKMDRGNHPQG